tara:strand:- start:440 stop:817 length:378 start_codon:yes stop_codon:yes gene_type:complete
MDGFSVWIGILIVSFFILLEWTNRNLNKRDYDIRELKKKLNLVHKHAGLMSAEMLRAQQIHPDTINKLARSSDKWKWVQENQAHFLEQRTLLEQGDTEASAYSSMEEFELDYESFLNDISEDTLI